VKVYVHAFLIEEIDEGESTNPFV